ncbi:MAG TPA: GldG family protein [Acidimicrobiales bacterium]|nr:GldG family protein [Acidimicrobiales bacterium]
MTAFARRVVMTVMVLAVLMAGEQAAGRVRHQYDLTAERSLSLSEESRDVVRRVHRRVKATAFIRPTDPGRAPAAALLDRYHRLNRRITFRLVDPDQSPGEVRRLGVDPIQGGLAVTTGDQVERAPSVTEQDVTSALARLLRTGKPGVCLTGGHGESDPTIPLDEGMSVLADTLTRNGYRLKVVDLVSSSAVPTDCDAVLMAGPQIPLGEAGAAVQRYLAAGGRALVLLDPASQADLNTLLRPYGLGFDRGVVFEGETGARLGDDPLSLVIRRFQSANPSVRNLPPLLVVGAQGVTVEARPPDGVSATALASSTRLGYLERAPAQPRFEPGIDAEGPVVVAAASDASSAVAGRVRRTRIVAVGDVDLVTNAFTAEGGNSRFVVQALDWLTLDEDLVSVQANIAALRPLELTGDRLAYARFLMAVALPLGFLLAGALVWAVRRSR